MAIFWISFKPIELADLRAPVPIVKEDLRGALQTIGDEAVLRYRLRNSSQSEFIRDVTLRDKWPDGLEALSLDPRCTISSWNLVCALGDWNGGHREKIQITVKARKEFVFENSTQYANHAQQYCFK